MAAVTIHTTQHVRIDYETAGVGHRIGAFAIDFVTILLSYWLIMFLLATAADFDGTANSLAIIYLAGIFYLLSYFFFWEMLSRGRTPGKLLLKLRVIRLDGRDPTPADFLTRAVFLIPDVLFTLGSMAVIFVATGSLNQRLGDIVAGTVVINTDDLGGVSLADILTIRNRGEHEARFPAVQRMTDDDMLVVKQCILRYRRYRNKAHKKALSTLSARMVALLELDPTDIKLSEEAFLEALLLDYIVLTR